MANPPNPPINTPIADSGGMPSPFWTRWFLTLITGIQGATSAIWGQITGKITDQTDLQAALNAKVPTTRKVNTTAPLMGGGDLSGDRTIAIDPKALPDPLLGLLANDTPFPTRQLLGLIDDAAVFSAFARSDGSAPTASVSGGGVRLVAAATDTLASTDRGGLVSYNRAGGVALTIPQGGTAGIDSTWFCWLENTGTGQVTITVAGGSTIDGVGSGAMKQNEGFGLFCDGTNYFTTRGLAHMADIYDVSAAGSADGQLLIFDQSVSQQWKPAVLAAGPGMVVTNAAGSIKLSTADAGGGTAGILSRTQPAVALNTVYQNTASKPQLIVVWFSLTAASGDFKAFSDGSNPPTSQVCSITGNTNTGVYPLIFPVAAGNYWKVTATSGTGGSNTTYTLTAGSGFVDSGDLGPSGANTRALATNYQNTSSSMQLVVVQLTGCTASTTQYSRGYCDFSSPPSGNPWASSPGGSLNFVCLLVPAGYYFKVTSDTGSIALWHEYTFSGVQCSQNIPSPVSNRSSVNPYLNNGRGSTLFLITATSNGTGTHTVYSAATNTGNVTSVALQAFTHAASASTLAVMLVAGMYPFEWLTYASDAGSFSIANWAEYILTAS